MNLAGRLLGTLIIATGVSSIAAAQKNPYRTYTEEKFVQNMQSASRNYGAVASFIGKSDYEPAKAQLTRAREQLAITVQYWRDVNKPDAVTMLREALKRMDDLDAALSKTPVDPAALRDVSTRINTACEACHRVYREQDPATKAYRVKSGSIR